MPTLNAISSSPVAPQTPTRFGQRPVAEQKPDPEPDDRFCQELGQGFAQGGQRMQEGLKSTIVATGLVATASGLLGWIPHVPEIPTAILALYLPINMAVNFLDGFVKGAFFPAGRDKAPSDKDES